MLMLVLFTSTSHGQSASRKKIIIDTDLFSDVDDAGALLLASTIDSAELLAVNVNYPSSYSAFAASSILGHYQHSHVPIGLTRPINDDTFWDRMMFEYGEFASKVAYHWRNASSLSFAEEAWDPVDLYRKILAEQDDDSVTIASIGFLENLSALLNSTADCYSQLSGLELVTAKVSELVIMGGDYPSGYEWNFYGFGPAITAHVVHTWPSAMTFLGSQVGENVLSGRRLVEEGPDADPVRSAYIWYNGRDKARYSWDPLTTLYAVQGLGELFKYGNSGGHNHIYPNGSNVWLPESKGNSQHWLELAVPPTAAGKVLDELFLDGARRFA
ncbi:hypothetical protein ASPWEDRAFT_175272 [Aspergillus wentii DTO 134E9]|uniref:Inosine/uridine-preferring nucleoside hydrolase domain-containing protein n=1 Tax=Aspergillus wentii DTO 134E9 TaxID=1073089 RepID=A0A1L9RAM4_ASPWE|nr:uncharacterized protein ASPWEDRAFT_175272 [Aspergillus wentii DTO 134E9]KAI9934545.1 hypothetical protein MW887_000159 [Aspergillus wentii]OJJ31960.1 hypothetical protein ASPWEDRAFT_175272 [Aspergillus wentii DTO 134E9]